MLRVQSRFFILLQLDLPWRYLLFNLYLCIPCLALPKPTKPRNGIQSVLPLSLLKAEILSAMEPVAMAPWSVHQPRSVFTWAGRSPDDNLGEGGAIFCQLGTTKQVLITSSPHYFTFHW